jgi:hypothetical protein
MTTASSAAIVTRFPGNHRVSGRFIIEEWTLSTEASQPPDEWRLEVHSKARATGLAAAVGAAAVVGSAATIWMPTRGRRRWVDVDL